jgi:hypothetical protein
MEGILAMLAGLLLGALTSFLLLRLKLASVILLGLGVVPLLALGVYVTAPDTYPRDCSDCGEYGGRYWEPAVVVLLGGLVWIGWIVGAATLRAVRRGRRAYAARTSDV